MTQASYNATQSGQRFYSLLPWALGLVLTLIFLFFLRAELQAQKNLWQSYVDSKTQDQLRYLDDVRRERGRQALFFAQSIAKNPILLNAISEANRTYLQAERVSHQESVLRARNLLQEQFTPYWQHLSQLGVSQLNIYFTPTDVAFLRMGSADSYGDSPSALGPQVTIAEMVASGKALTKFTVASEGSGYRAIVPFSLAAGADVSTVEADVFVEIFMPSIAIPQAASDTGIQAAIFLHRQPVETILSTQTRKQLDEISLLLRDDWHLEKTTDSLLLSWWNQGIVPIEKQEALLHSMDKFYVTSWQTERDDAEQRESGIAQFVWTEITKEYQDYSSLRRGILARWILAAVITLSVMCLLLLMNKRRATALQQKYNQVAQADQSATEQILNRMRLALRSGDSGTWEWNIQYQTAKFSPEWRLLCGLGPESPQSLDLDEWLNRMHPTDKHASYAELVRHIKGEIPVYENEYRLRIANGTYKWIFARGRVVEWQADGKAAVMIGIYSDITDRKQAELNSIRHQAALRALNEIANISQGNLVQQLRSALAIAAKYFALNQGIVVEADGNHYKIKAHYTEDRINHEQDILPLESSYAGLIHTKRELFAEDNTPSTDHFKQLAFIHTQVESCIGIPLWVEGRLFGSVIFSAPNSRQYAYDPVDKDFVKLLAHWMSLTVEYHQQIANKKDILHRLDKLTERLPGFIYQYQEGTDGRSFFPYVSIGIKTLFNFSPEVAAVSAAQFFKFIHAEDQTWVRNTLSYSSTHLTPWVATVRMVSSQRGLIWMHFESAPEKLADGSVVWYGYASDITAFKKLEAESHNKIVKTSSG
jgi:PAS domain S-box-containing protein